jgi:hypothetical protein
VTIENLLTHTAGFEDRNIGIAALSYEDMIPMQEFLTSRQPSRIMPPGEYLSYSNYGYTLLGYLVETLSGLPFPQYIEERILVPLGMMNSSFDYRKDLLPDLASAYAYRNGKYTKLPQVYLNIGPAGALLSTPGDISRFMCAHLQGGYHRGRRILMPETVTRMHERLFAQHPLLAGWCYGFSERFVNDLRVIGHPGDINGFASLLSLIPEKKTGVFICYNGGEGLVYGFREKVIEDFIHHFFPESKMTETIPTSDHSGDELRRYRGTYRLNRYSWTSLEKLSALAIESNIKSSEDGSLTLRLLQVLKIPPTRWVWVEPLLFRNPENGRYLSFYEDDKGRITHLNMFAGVPANLIRVPWYGTGKFNLILLGTLLIIFLTVVPGRVMNKGFRKLLGKSAVMHLPTRRTRTFLSLVSSLNLLFIVGFGAVLAVLGVRIALGIPWILKIVLCIPFISITCWVMLIYMGYRDWKREWLPAGRVQYLCIVASSLAYYWFLNYWNLLGFKY